MPNKALPALGRRRALADRILRIAVGFGGGAVILAIALLFFYLLWVVAPVFTSARFGPPERVPVRAAETLLVDSNDSGDVGVRILPDHLVEFFSFESGATLNAYQLPHAVRSARRHTESEGVYSLRTPADELLLVQARYDVTYVDDQRRVNGTLRYPMGTNPIAPGVDGWPLAYDLMLSDSRLSIASIGGTALHLKRFEQPVPGAAAQESSVLTLPIDARFNRVFFGPQGRWLVLLSSTGRAQLVRVSQQRLVPLGTQNLLPPGQTVLTAAPLLGRFSMLVAGSDESLRQWMPVASDSGQVLASVRSFDLTAPVVALASESRRKGFLALDSTHQLKLFHATSGQHLATRQLDVAQTPRVSFTPRADAVLVLDSAGNLNRHRLRNEHPELTWRTLWGKVWYEGYNAPRFSWQSSSADNAFEPKFSLTPLAFGTFKAALYALVIAVPVAVLAALYSAYFMAPQMRRWVKPTIETMAALPTVVLGFLAGLWLAPLVERNLAGVLVLLPCVVVLTLIVGAGVARLPRQLLDRLEGWYVLILVPVVLLGATLAFPLGQELETVLFDGNLRQWLSLEAGIDYDQRNALVVGLAMGLAVIPTIFSLTEDALYGVPQHLSHGALALGATRWQTLTRVVLLTASPGIFSAVMIGFGRAVGETMIVLMATGNTPLMEWNPFQGMRTFAANIAVELPESEVDSTHFRILFLAALVLFILTFLLNSLAEFVRSRLRARYGNL
ncbi:MAG: ABC transporter permease subunit [Pseudomonadota bacterium]